MHPIGIWNLQLLKFLKRQKNFTTKVQNTISRTFMKNVSLNNDLLKSKDKHPSLFVATQKLNIKSLADFQFMYIAQVYG